MAVGDINKSVLAIAIAIFTLLGVLFGMNIMTFIFGNLGPTQAGLTDGSVAFNLSQKVQNDSLSAIGTYSGQAGTQLNIAAVAVTLIILLMVFGIFWGFFMGRKGGGSGNFSQ